MLSGTQFDICLKLDYDTAHQQTIEYLRKETYERIQIQGAETNLIFPEQIAFAHGVDKVEDDDIVQLIKLRQGSKEVHLTAVIQNVSFITIRFLRLKIFGCF